MDGIDGAVQAVVRLGIQSDLSRRYLLHPAEIFLLRYCAAKLLHLCFYAVICTKKGTQRCRIQQQGTRGLLVQEMLGPVYTVLVAGAQFTPLSTVCRGAFEQEIKPLTAPGLLLY